MISENIRRLKMGGYGSGRPASKRKADGCRTLDVNRLNREGCLRPGWQGHWQWSRDGKQVASIGCKATETSFVLGYRIQLNGDDWEPITQPIPITRIDCHYGNQRPYFRCPGVMNGRHCGRRVGKLFLGGKYFLCRHCYNVAYTSQSEAHYDRALRRANKTRMALGGEPGTAHWIKPKPKGMWQRTYQRKCWEIEHYEYQADLRFLSKFAHLMSKSEREMFFD
jgi:hypothetical protein